MYCLFWRYECEVCFAGDCGLWIGGGGVSKDPLNLGSGGEYA